VFLCAEASEIMTRHSILRSRARGRTSIPGIALLACLALSACHYDLDELFEGEILDGGMSDDGGMQSDVPAQLIELWKDKPYSSYSAACAACAATKCAAVNTSCKGDAQCLAFTKCIAQGTDPVTQSLCRAQHAGWLSEDVLARDVGGPYAQCVLQDRCTEECGSRTNFSCVGKFAWPTNDGDIPFRFRFNEAFTGEEVADMLVKVCRADDLHCAAPTFMDFTDANGEVALTLRTALRSFQGYLELTKKTDKMDTSIYPSLVRLGWPITQEGVTNITVINESSVALNVAISQVAPDPNRGLLQVRFYSCTGYAAPGVSFTTSLADEASRYWYADVDGVPNFMETRTYMIGAGGVINAIEGRHTITSTYSTDNGVTITKVGETAAPVRAGWMTIVLVPPLGAN
jgi:hypothetical protein